MECLAVPKLPDGPKWLYEIKLDGYRAIAVKSSGKLNLFSRRRNSFNRQYSLVFEALADLPTTRLLMVRLWRWMNPGGRTSISSNTTEQKPHAFTTSFSIFSFTTIAISRGCHLSSGMKS